MGLLKQWWWELMIGGGCEGMKGALTLKMKDVDDKTKGDERYITI